MRNAAINRNRLLTNHRVYCHFVLEMCPYAILIPSTPCLIYTSLSLLEARIRQA